MTKQLICARNATTGDFEILVISADDTVQVVQTNIRTREKAAEVLQYWVKFTGIPGHGPV